MAEEAGRFDFAEVARTIADKMVRRHPHVFGDAAARDAAEQTVAWEAHKTRRACRQSRNRHAGWRAGWPPCPDARRQVDGPRRPGRLRLARRAAVLANWMKRSPSSGRNCRRRPDRLADEVGDLLFVIANLARKLDLDPEPCLRQANLKFCNRFNAMEQRAAAAGSALSELSLEEMEEEWRKVKHNRRLGT